MDCRIATAARVAAITPGLDFGSHRAKAHARFAHTTGMSKLEDGVDRLARFVRGR
jgi:aspartate/methionine/tyrosine aminotransferase